MAYLCLALAITGRIIWALRALISLAVVVRRRTIKPSEAGLSSTPSYYNNKTYKAA